MVCLKRAGGGGLHFVFRKSERKKNQREKRATCAHSVDWVASLLSTHFSHLYCIIIFYFVVRWTVLGSFFLSFLCQVGINRVRGGSAVVSNSRFSFVIRGSFVFGICGGGGDQGRGLEG